MSTIDTRLLEQPSTRAALLAVATEMRDSSLVVDISTIRAAMNWEWFHAAYAMRFHGVWKELGIKPH